MIKLALFDLGETIIHDTTPFPHAVAALRAIRTLQTADHESLAIGLVSDFLPADPPVTEAKIAAREQEYRGILEQAGLSELFEPFASCVTLSTRAGVNKPDRGIFELAIKRSGIGATLAECAFTTENTGHLAKCREYGMAAVRFGSGPGLTPAFSDWADAPALFAGLLDPANPHNHAIVVAADLDARHGLIDFKPSAMARGLDSRGQARRLVELNDPRLGDLKGIYVELPTDVTVSLGPNRRVKSVTATPPGKDEVADAVNFVSGLAKSGKIAMPGKTTLGATHAVETDAAGRKRLVRRGFSAY